MRAYYSTFPKKVFEPSDSSIEDAAQKAVIGPDAPAEPLITGSSKILSIGSCFAEEIATALTKSSLNVVYTFISERWNSAFLLDLFLAKALDNEPLPEGFKRASNLESAPLASKPDVIILTLGLSLCWFDRANNIVAEPGSTYSREGYMAAARNHVMKQTSPQANVDAISRAIHRLQRHFPQAKIILTLSPIPLLGSVAKAPVVQGNAVSKAVLRLAIEVVREALPVYYWPSYEIVDWYGKHIDRAFGNTDLDARHVRPEVIDLITSLFIKNYVRR